MSNGPAAIINAINAATPESRLWIRWKSPADNHVTTPGVVTAVDHDAGSLQLEPYNRSDHLQITVSNTEIAVHTITASQAIKLGRVQEITFKTPPTKTLTIAEAGVTVPDELVGYAGMLEIEDRYGSRHRRIPAPGLDETDDRLLARYSGADLAPTYDALEATISTSDTHNTYEIQDDRIATAVSLSHHNSTELPPPVTGPSTSPKHIARTLVERTAAVLESCTTDSTLERAPREDAIDHIIRLHSTGITICSHLLETDLELPIESPPESQPYATELDQIDELIHRLYEHLPFKPQAAIDDEQFRNQILWCRTQTTALRTILDRSDQ